jgi:hypothetical protein
VAGGRRDRHRDGLDSRHHDDCAFVCRGQKRQHRGSCLMPSRPRMAPREQAERSALNGRIPRARSVRDRTNRRSPYGTVPVRASSNPRDAEQRATPDGSEVLEQCHGVVLERAAGENVGVPGPVRTESGRASAALADVTGDREGPTRSPGCAAWTLRPARSAPCPCAPRTGHFAKLLRISVV